MRTIDACNEQTLGNNQSIAILAFTSTQESRPFVVQSTQSWTILHFSTSPLFHSTVTFSPQLHSFASLTERQRDNTWFHLRTWQWKTYLPPDHIGQALWKCSYHVDSWVTAALNRIRHVGMSARWPPTELKANKQTLKIGLH